MAKKLGWKNIKITGASREGNHPEAGKTKELPCFSTSLEDCFESIMPDIRRNKCAYVYEGQIFYIRPLPYGAWSIGEAEPDNMAFAGCLAYLQMKKNESA